MRKQMPGMSLECADDLVAAFYRISGGTIEILDPTVLELATIAQQHNLPTNRLPIDVDVLSVDGTAILSWIDDDGVWCEHYHEMD